MPQESSVLWCGVQQPDVVDMSISQAWHAHVQVTEVYRVNIKARRTHTKSLVLH